MSILGIDIGAAGCVISTIGNRSITTVLNDLSERITAPLVAFTPNERHIGNAALAGMKSNYKNTCRGMVNLIGKSFNDPSVALEQQFALSELAPTADGSVGYLVQYKEESTVMSAVSVFSSLLGHLKRMCERSTNLPVRDVVIAIPGHFSDKERRSLIAACEAANLNCLRVMNEHAAIALDYGIYRQSNFDAEKSTTVAFVDVGQSRACVSICEFTKKGVKVLSNASDDYISGRLMDLKIMEHFSKDLSKKAGFNILNNVKTRLKFEDSAVRAKKILSANTEAPFAVEYAYEETDVTGLLTRAEFEALCEDMKPRFAEMIKRAVHKAGITSLDQIEFVELVGGCTRIPFIQQSIKESFGKEELCKTLNMEETVSRGCALQAAMLSPQFKVRDFQVQDCIDYNVCLKTGEKEYVVFQQGSDLDTLKSITFENKIHPFEMSTSLQRKQENGEVLIEALDQYVVNIPADYATNWKEGNYSRIKIKMRLTIHGTIIVENCLLLEDESYTDVVVEKVLKQKAEGEDEKMEETQEGEGEEKKEEYEEVKKEVLKTRTKKKEVSITILPRQGILLPNDVRTLYENEVEMYDYDRQHIEKNEKLNELESLVYACRSDNDGVLKAFLNQSELENLSVCVDDTEQWLWDHGNDSSKSDIVAKITALRSRVQVALARKSEKIAAEEAAIAAAQAAAHAAAQAAAQPAEEEQPEMEDTNMEPQL